MAGTLGRAFGNLLMEGIAKIPGVDLPREKERRKQEAIQSIMGKSFSGLEQSIAQGTDAGDAQIRAIADASARMAAEGFTQEATEMRMQLVKLVQSQETRKLEQDKLRAETTHKRTQILEALEPEKEDEPKDELTRMQQRRELLLAHFKNNPNSEALAEQLDEVNARIDKITAPAFGMTDADERRLSPTKPVMTKLQESFINTSERLDGIRSIGKNMNVEALTLGGKVKKAFFTAKEIAGLELSPEEKRQLTDQAEFLQTAAMEMNEYIRSITGAAMTVAEIPRLKKGMPDPERDSPTEFIAKYNFKLKQLEAIQKRSIDVMRSGNLEILATPLDAYMEFDLENFDPNAATDEEVDAAIRQLTQ